MLRFRFQKTNTILFVSSFIAAFICATPVMLVAGLSKADTNMPPKGLHPGPMSRQDAALRAELLARLGQKMFFDASLSASGQQSCSSCHDPAHAFSPAKPDAVMTGGPDLQAAGVRAAPSLRYLQAVPQFSEHYFESEDEADESIDNGPTGGLTWDGRVDSGAEQAKIPLLATNEMANKDAASFAKSLEKTAYSDDITEIFGKDIFHNPNDALEAAVISLQAFEQVPAVFYPYSSRYDAYLNGKAELSEQELRGLQLFKDENKGNCSSCHIAERANDGTPPQFSDFGMLGLAVPRNHEIEANRNPDYFDLGLCGPYRSDLKDHSDYCGLFRTPTLRNVALKQSFFHNGVFHTLRDAVAFYASRDTDPARWYGKKPDGSPDQYNDLPKQYWANINQDPPFGRKPGEAPALNDSEIDDIVAFLKTLTDADLEKNAR